MRARTPIASLRSGGLPGHSSPVSSFQRDGRGARGGPAAAFTLLELLVVIAILVAVAATALVSLSDSGSTVDRRLAEVQVRRVREALQAFRSDTGCWPRQGPFRPVGEGGSTAEPDAGAAWFHSPLNLGQLIHEPLRPDGAPVMPLDPHTGRGWRGPYLLQGHELYVDVGSGLLSNGSGNPTDGLLLERVPAVPDLIARGVSPSPYLRWWYLDVTADGLTVLPMSAGLDRGRPIAVFDFDDASLSRVVSFGADGVYATPDDIVVLLRR